MKAAEFASYSFKETVSESFGISEDRYRELHNFREEIVERATVVMMDQATINNEKITINILGITLNEFFKADFEYNSPEELLLVYRELSLRIHDATIEFKRHQLKDS